jgi:fructokinase
MDVVCLGELLIDMFPAEVGRSLVAVSAFRPKPGGAPANVAVAAARLGARSAFIGKVGEDIFGHFLEDTLTVEGVSTQGLRYDGEARTTLVFIAMPDENTAEFVFYRNPGADTRLAPAELDHSLLQEARFLHFGSLSLTDEPARSATYEAVSLARGAGAQISYDVNYRPSLWKEPAEAIARALAIIPSVDLLKVNETELRLLGGSDDLESAACSLLELGPSLCVVTLGPRGSFFQSKAGSGFVPAFPVHTVDATGCGDAFVAGLVCRLLSEGQPVAGLAPVRLHRALRYANAAGALTAQTQGVIPALPTAAQVESFLAQSNA